MGKVRVIYDLFSCYLHRLTIVVCSAGEHAFREINHVIRIVTLMIRKTIFYHAIISMTDSRFTLLIMN